MNIKAIAAGALKTIFQLTESVQVACTYRQPGAVAYDAAAGTVTPNFTSTAVNALVSLYEAKESDSPARREGQRRMIVQRTELASVTPTLADSIVEGSTVWQIVDFDDDMTEATFAFIVKRGQA